MLCLQHHGHDAGEAGGVRHEPGVHRAEPHLGARGGEEEDGQPTVQDAASVSRGSVLQTREINQYIACT